MLKQLRTIAIHSAIATTGALFVLLAGAQEKQNSSTGLYGKRAELKEARTRLAERQKRALEISAQLTSQYNTLKQSETKLLAAESKQSSGRKWRCNAYHTEHDDPSQCSDPSQGGEWIGGEIDPTLVNQRQQLTDSAAKYEADYSKYEAALDRLEADAQAFKQQVDLATAGAPDLLKSLLRIDDFLARNAEINDCNKAAIASANEIGYTGFDGMNANDIFKKVVANEDKEIVRLGSETAPNSDKVSENETPLEKGFDLASRPNKYRVFLAIDAATLASQKPASLSRTYSNGHIMELVPGGTSWRTGEVIQAVHNGPKLHVAPLGGVASSATAAWQRPHYQIFAIPVKSNRTIR